MLQHPTTPRLHSYQSHLEHLATTPLEILDPVTSEEISTIINSLPLKKAAGHDNLVNEH